MLGYKLSRKQNKKIIKNEIQWGGGITGHLLFTPVMSHESEVYRFYIFKINILTGLVYLIIYSVSQNGQAAIVAQRFGRPKKSTSENDQHYIDQLNLIRFSQFLIDTSLFYDK